MIRVKLSTNFPDWPLIRQTPGRAGIWGDCRFFINEAIDECDYWVVYDDVLRPETTRCPPQNTLLITGEPPPVKSYPSRFLAQFARVLTCQRGLTHPNVVYSQQAQPWMIGRRYLSETQTWAETDTQDYDALSALSVVPKTKRLSVIASDKAFTPGHRQRLEFVECLKQYFGEEIDVYGRGIRAVEDKWDAIAPYEYHVVIENSRYPDYWTEKLSDTLLASAYPFYAGCPNIEEYFPGGVLTPLDITDPEGAVAAIAAGMKEDRFAATLAHRQEARHTLLDTYTLFPMLEKMIVADRSARPAKTLRLSPQARYSQTPASKARHLVRKLWK